jgi:hypothetical protein
MSKILMGAAFLTFYLFGVCLAQSTDGVQPQASGVTLSTTVTNSNYAVGAKISLFAVARNNSTDDLHLGSFIISLTGDGGKTYQLTQPELGNFGNIGGDIRNLVRPGRVRNWQIDVDLSHYIGAFGIEWVDKDVEPGVYTLKAVQYYDGDKSSVESNVLKIRIKP